MICNSDKPISLISFGEILWDVIEGQPHLGGAALNLAAHAARLGMHARLISCVGDDALGQQALGEAARFGVDVTGIQCHPVYPTGIVTVQLSGGQPEYTIQDPAAWDFIETVPRSFLGAGEDRVKAICFGTLAQRSQASRQTLRDLLADFSETPCFYDVNLRQGFWTPEIIEWGLRKATVVKLNDAEAAVLSPLLLGQELTARVFAQKITNTYDVPVVLVTLGADGSLVATGSGVTHVPGRTVSVVDTVGAGDAFSAGFLSAWLRGKSPIEAAALGNSLGAYVATQRGAVPKYSAHLHTQISGFGAAEWMETNNANLQ